MMTALSTHLWGTVELEVFRHLEKTQVGMDDVRLSKTTWKYTIMDPIAADKVVGYCERRTAWTKNKRQTSCSSPSN